MTPAAPATRYVPVPAPCCCCWLLLCSLWRAALGCWAAAGSAAAWFCISAQCMVTCGVNVLCLCALRRVRATRTPGAAAAPALAAALLPPRSRPPQQQQPGRSRRGTWPTRRPLAETAARLVRGADGRAAGSGAAGMRPSSASPAAASEHGCHGGRCVVCADGVEVCRASAAGGRGAALVTTCVQPLSSLLPSLFAICAVGMGAALAISPSSSSRRGQHASQPGGVKRAGRAAEFRS